MKPSNKRESLMSLRMRPVGLVEAWATCDLTMDEIIDACMRRFNELFFRLRPNGSPSVQSDDLRRRIAPTKFPPESVARLASYAPEDAVKAACLHRRLLICSLEFPLSTQLFKTSLQILATALMAVCLSQGAHAEKRVALLIGNSAYQNVGRLANPTNDADAMASTLKAAGFDVVELKRDLKVAEMRRVLRDFSDVTRDADVAIVYYAGHGIEIDGTNYIIPTDAVLERDIDAFDEAIPLDRLLTVIEPARQLRLVILDACRDNPFGQKMKRTIGARAISRGLAKVEPANPNTLIAFASKAGSTASDGEKNSPFTTALVKHLVTPGLDLRKAFGYVRDDVLRNTGNKQEPYVYGSLGGDDFPLVPARPKPEASTGPQASPQDAVRRDYELALQLSTRGGWTGFLTQYPEGFYANLAKGQIDKIVAEDARAAAAEKARQAEDEKVRLAADRASKVEQEKAAAAAKAAEDSRLAAEKTKKFEEAKAAAAEERRKDAEVAVAKTAVEKQSAQPVNEPPAADADQKIAALTPSDRPSVPAPREITQLVQTELRRVGCLSGKPDGDWDAASQKSLTLFNKYALTKFDGKLATPDVLEAVKAKTGRVCPLVCDHGFRADGDSCAKIACLSGYRINDDNDCEKVQEKKPIASREETKKRDLERKKAESQPAKTEASGQIVCDRGGCHPVSKGCRLVRGYQNGVVGLNAKEVCN